MDISLLSSFLAPFLPFLVQTGEDLGRDAVEKLGPAAWGFATRIWERLRPTVEEKPAALEAAADVAAAAEDPRARGALELQLEKLLAADVDLSEDIARLFAQAQEAGVVASGERAVAIGGDVTSSTVVTGDQNTIGR